MLVGTGLGAAQQAAVTATAETLSLRCETAPFGGSGDPSLDLYHAARFAREQGADKLVWPEQPVRAHGSAGSLEMMSAAVDRAGLVERLVNLDSWAGLSEPRHEILIESPLADLSDEQVADLVADLELPVDACWFWADPSENAAALRERWGAVLRERGYRSVPA